MRTEKADMLRNTWLASLSSGVEPGRVDRAVQEIPEPDAWAVGSDPNALLVLAGTVLFTVTSEGPNVLVTTRQLRRERLVVSRLHDRLTNENQGVQRDSTQWTFTLAGLLEPWLSLAGDTVKHSNRAEDPDNSEQLGRAIARLAGWTIPTP
jgi:hypothetical protein